MKDSKTMLQRDIYHRRCLLEELLGVADTVVVAGFYISLVLAAVVRIKLDRDLIHGNIHA